MRCTKYMRKTASRFLTIHSFGQCPWNLSVRCWSFCFCTRGEGCRGPWQGCGRWLDSYCRSDRFMGYSSLASALLGPEARGCLIASIVERWKWLWAGPQSALSSLRRSVGAVPGERGPGHVWPRLCHTARWRDPHPSRPAKTLYGSVVPGPLLGTRVVSGLSCPVRRIDFGHIRSDPCPRVGRLGPDLGNGRRTDNGICNFGCCRSLRANRVADVAICRHLGGRSGLSQG